MSAAALERAAPAPRVAWGLLYVGLVFAVVGVALAAANVIEGEADASEVVDAIVHLGSSAVLLPVGLLVLGRVPGNPLGPIFATDQPASSHHTRQALGWEPTHPSLLDDLELIEP